MRKYPSVLIPKHPRDTQKPIIAQTVAHRAQDMAVCTGESWVWLWCSRVHILENENAVYRLVSLSRIGAELIGHYDGSVSAQDVVDDVYDVMGWG